MTQPAETRKKTQPTSAVKATRPAPAAEVMPFRRLNYLLLAVGAILLLIGYSLLLVPAHFVDAKEFSPALYIAPVVIMGGFGTLLYAILKR